MELTDHLAGPNPALRACSPGRALTRMNRDEMAVAGSRTLRDIGPQEAVGGYVVAWCHLRGPREFARYGIEAVGPADRGARGHSASAAAPPPIPCTP